MNDIIRLVAFLFVPFLVFGEVIEVDVGAERFLTLTPSILRT